MRFEKQVLANGLRVILAPRPGATSVSFLILVEAGSKYETKNINGLSHFLEHLCFKGTMKRPAPLQIASELDSLGASYNAFTSQEFTGYYVTVMPKHLDRALEIISDMYLNPLFNEAEIEKEKGVIIEEINMYEDLPPRLAGELIMTLLYGDTPAGWNIAGTKEVVRRLARADFLDYRSKHYLAPATVAVVAGDFSDSVLGKIQTFLGALPAGNKSNKLPVSETQINPAALWQTKSLDQSHIILACRAEGLSSADHYAYEVLSAVLGGGMSSRLFRRIREEMGAAYYVKANQDAFTDHGFIAVAAGLNNQALVPATRAILEEMARLKKEIIPESELRRVKDSLIGNLYLDLETSQSLANFLGLQEVLKRELLAPEEVAERIEAVTVNHLRAAAEKVFINSGLNFVAVGPTVDERVILDILKF